MIYHLCLPRDWERALQTGIYKHPSLQTEGFIHCSEKEQVLASAKRHFPDAQELVVLCLVEKRLKGMVKREPATSGELFPHIYGPFEIEAVEKTDMLIRSRKGEWEWVT